MSRVLTSFTLLMTMASSALAQTSSLEQLSKMMAIQQSEIRKLRDELKSTKEMLSQAIATNQSTLSESIVSVQNQCNSSETALASQVSTLEAKMPSFANGKVIFYTGALFHTLEYNTANGTWLYKNNFIMPVGPFPRF